MNISGSCWHTLKNMDYAFRACQKKAGVELLIQYNKEQEKKILEAYGEFTSKELNKIIGEIKKSDSDKRKLVQREINNRIKSEWFLYRWCLQIGQSINIGEAADIKKAKRERIIESVIKFIIIFEKNAEFSILNRELACEMTDENLKSNLLEGNKTGHGVYIGGDKIDFFGSRNNAYKLLLSAKSKISLDELIIRSEAAHNEKMNSIKNQLRHDLVNALLAINGARLEQLREAYPGDVRDMRNEYKEESCKNTYNYFKALEVQYFKQNS